MLFILAACAGIVWGFIRGGSLRRLAYVRIRGGAMILAALGLQVFAFGPWAAGDGWVGRLLRGGAWSRAIHLGSYALVAAGAGLNWRVPGFTVVICGMLMNLAVILANGGRMPVSGGALERAGMWEVLTSLESCGSGVNNVVLMARETRIRWLGDLLWIHLPPVVSGAFSVGDLVIAVGIALAVSGSMAVGSKAGGVREGDR